MNYWTCSITAGLLSKTSGCSWPGCTHELLRVWWAQLSSAAPGPRRNCDPGSGARPASSRCLPGCVTGVTGRNPAGYKERSPQSKLLLYRVKSQKMMTDSSTSDINRHQHTCALWKTKPNTNSKSLCYHEVLGTSACTSKAKFCSPEGIWANLCALKAWATQQHTLKTKLGSSQGNTATQPSTQRTEGPNCGLMGFDFYCIQQGTREKRLPLWLTTRDKEAGASPRCRHLTQVPRAYIRTCSTCSRQSGARPLLAQLAGQGSHAGHKEW